MNFSKLKFIFRDLKYRNFRLYFFGQIISMSGTWMQQVALGWLVYRLTNSVLMLGVVSFATQIPALLFLPLGGIIADRFDKHKVLIVTQILAMLQAFILAITVLSGAPSILALIFLGVFLGLVNAEDWPARQAIVIDLVENKKDLPNAVALNSAVSNAARFIGPAIAGIIIFFYGEGICFLINALSYIPVIFILLTMRINYGAVSAGSFYIFKELKEEFKYIFSMVPVRSLLFLVASISLFVLPYTVLLPVFAKDILNGNAETLGWLGAAGGLGALIGVLYLASRKSIIGLNKVIISGSLVAGFGLVIFSVSNNFFISLLIIFLVSAFTISALSSANTILQTIVADNKRGGVMSYYMMAWLGLAPFASLLAGSLATYIGVRGVVFIDGIALILVALIFYKKLPMIRKSIYPVYEQLGLVSEK